MPAQRGVFDPGSPLVIRRGDFSTRDGWIGRRAGLVSDQRRPIGGQAGSQHGGHPMSAQATWFETDVFGAFPALLLVLVLVLTLLGVLAQVAFG